MLPGDHGLAGLDDVAWDRFAQPSWNKPGEIAAALRALADPADADRQRPYHRLLYALGNDHAGTYFPVVLEAIPFLGAILKGRAAVARLRALDCLIDLVGAFEPERGHDEVETAAGRRPLRALVRDAAQGLRSDVEGLRDAPASETEAHLAEDFLGLIG